MMCEDKPCTKAFCDHIEGQVPSESAVPAMPERWDSSTSNPMDDIEEGIRLVRGQPDCPEVITPETARAMAAALNDVVAQIDAGRFHDPTVDCRHADKEECDECNDCGAVVIVAGGSSKPDVAPSFLIPASEFKELENRIDEAERYITELTLRLNEAVVAQHMAEHERDARTLDESMRAQRVDVESLRRKVAEMKKNLAAVDSRADARFVAQLRARDSETESRIAAVRAEVQPTIDELDKVRTGEQARVEALNAALEMIWAFDKREPGCAYNSQNLIANLRQVLSAARKHAQ